MAKINDLVSLKVHKSFFENIFEPERKRLQGKLGISNFSQAKFTEFLDKSKIKIKYPKRMFNVTPKKLGIGGGLRFNF